MRLIAVIFTILICSCKNKPKQREEIKVKEFDMATVAEQPKISKLDSIAVAKIWKKLREVILDKNEAAFRQMSFKEVNSSVTEDKWLYQTDIKRLYREDFINTFLHNISYCKLLPAIRERQPLIRKRYGDVDIFEIFFSIDDTATKYSIYTDYSFQFKRQKDTLKFYALEALSSCNQLPYSKDYSKLYFPLTNKNATPSYNKQAIDTFLNQWYSDDLATMQEPVLKNYKGEDKILRFTWLRAFNAPIAIRVQSDGLGYLLTTKKIEFRGIFRTDTVLSSTKWISLIEWMTVGKNLNKAGFWDADAKDSLEDRGFDGSEWILEAAHKGKYHFTSRWAGGEKDYEACGRYLLKISGLNIPKDQQY